MKTPRTILVVDDNGVNRLLPGLILRPFGWEVHEVENGVNALEFLKRMKFACVLLDISMPDVNGYEVLSEIKRDSRQLGVKIIAYTAYAKPEDVSCMLSMGFDAVLLKPLTSRKILDVLEVDA